MGFPFKILGLCWMFAFAAAARGDVFNMPSGRTSITMVPVRNPGNAADPATGGVYGSVGYNYDLNAYDVTFGQYCKFLNAVAKSDPYGCYNYLIGADHFTPFGISQSGTAGSYSYSVTGSNPQGANMPIYSVSWLDAARFCNWL